MRGLTARVRSHRTLKAPAFQGLTTHLSTPRMNRRRRAPRSLAPRNLAPHVLDSRIIRVSPDIAQLKLGCSCAYVLGKGPEFWLVDTGTCWDWPLWRVLLPELGLSLDGCRGIVLTHAHPDHAGNAAWLARVTGAPLYAHPEEQPYLQGKSYASKAAPLWDGSNVMFGLGRGFMPVARCSTLSPIRDGDELATPSGTWRVIHTPGHTPGHIALYRAQDGVLLTGDALLNVHSFSRQEGLTLPLPIYATDVDQAQASVQKFASLPVTAVLPGHGNPLLGGAQTKLRAFLEGF